jgi:Uma2 family endonuclease
MNATLTPPPAPNYPRPLVPKWTVTEFHHMAGMGWFTGRRPFLLDGVIMEQGPMNPAHAMGVLLVEAALRAVFGSGWVIRGQLPLAIDEHNDPFPDFAVVQGSPRDFPGVHPTTAALVVEVSDTTLQLDLTEKAERYATAGVPEYWVLDLTARELTVLRDPQPLPKGLGATAYRTRLTFRVGDHVSPLAVPASVAVAELLP